jgi:hypothetical protein
MEKTSREYDKEKLVKLLNDFPAAYHSYLCNNIDEAQNATSEEEWNHITENRLTKEQYFVEYLLNNGVQFERVGHWVCGNDDQDNWTCSECGFPVMPADYYCDPYEAEIEYCEKCGTRMTRKKA